MSHIALVIPTLDRIGGAEQQTILLAQGLQARGWQVSVVALSGSESPACAALLAHGVTFLSLCMRNGLADPRGWIRFHRWLRRTKPDIVHAHLSHAAWLARWSRLAVPVRVLVDTLHSSSTGTKGRRLGYHFSKWLPDRVTAVSHAVAETHLAAHMVRPRYFQVLPNGIDPGQWQPDAMVRSSVRQEFGLEDSFVWFAAGRLEAVKDYPTLLRAFAATPESARLIIAGDGPLAEGLRSLSRQLGIEHRVSFLGFEPNVLRWMQSADGFVLTSRWEGLPMALLEASASALPAVVTDIPGTSEVMLQGLTGLLVPVGSVFAVQSAMTRLMHLPLQDRCTMGRRARRNVETHFSLSAVLDRWEELYNGLLESNTKVRRWSKQRKPGTNSPEKRTAC